MSYEEKLARAIFCEINKIDPVEEDDHIQAAFAGAVDGDTINAKEATEAARVALTFLSTPASQAQDTRGGEGFADWLATYVGKQDANKMRFSVDELRIAYEAGAAPALALAADDPDAATGSADDLGLFAQPGMDEPAPAADDGR